LPSRNPGDVFIFVYPFSSRQVVPSECSLLLGHFVVSLNLTSLHDHKSWSSAGTFEVCRGPRELFLLRQRYETCDDELFLSLYKPFLFSPAPAFFLCVRRRLRPYSGPPSLSKSSASPANLISPLLLLLSLLVRYGFWRRMLWRTFFPILVSLLPFCVDGELASSKTSVKDRIAPPSFPLFEFPRFLLFPFLGTREEFILPGVAKDGP